jgi:putative ABC transport system permease protein
MLKNYFTTAFRNLARNKIYSFINIAGLSLGLACAMLIMLYVKDEVSYDKFHKNTRQLYRVNRRLTRDNGNIDKSGYTGYLQGPRFTANIPEIETFVRYQQVEMDIKNGANIQSQEIFLAGDTVLIKTLDSKHLQLYHDENRPGVYFTKIKQ